MGIDVVGAVLGIVLDDEDRHLRPEFAAARGSHDLAHADIVAGDAGVGGRRAGGRAAGVVFAERHDGEAGELAGEFCLLQILDPEIHLVLVRRSSFCCGWWFM